MPETGSSPQRTAAAVHLNHARAHLVKHRVDRAFEEAHLAVEADPAFEEGRHFLAELHESQGEKRKAVHQYEELLFRHPHDEELLRKIEALDPLTAAKHRRLGEVAPDPFVSAGRLATGSADDLDEMEMVDGGAGTGGPVVGTLAPEGPVDLEAMEEFAADEAGGGPVLTADAGVFEDGEIAGAAPAAVPAAAYEYEDDRQFRESASAIPAVQELLKRQRGMWGDRETLDELLAGTRPLTYTESEEAANAFYYAASTLGVHTTVPCLLTDPGLWPLSCGPMCAYVVIPAGVLEALNPTELYFLAGRTLARIACEHVGLLDVIAAVLPQGRSGPRLQETLRRVVADSLGGPGKLGDEALRRRAQQHLHTWRLRAELTADRAGLVCCQSPEDAASAIAKLTATDAAGAAGMSPEALEQRFAGQDLGQVAAIGPDRDPASSEPYAYYRIRMLKWWSTQPGFKRLVG